MIIQEPESVKHDDHTIVYSKIELLRPPANFPEYLWYKVPNSYSKFLSPQSDAFLIPGLLAGMHFQENIEVRGTVSPRLASMPEIAGGAVYLVNPYKVEELSAGIYCVATDEQLRHALEEKGLEQARFFSWEETAARILSGLLSAQ